MIAPAVQWQWLPFAALDGASVHAMLLARQQVFVLEQQCLYPDIDARDLHAMHLLGWRQAAAGKSSQDTAELLAYLRCMGPQSPADDVVFGRVLVAESARRSGLGRQLMHEGLARARAQFPGHRLRLSAQAHLQQFYAEHGFACISDIYLEDDIPHVTMVRAG